jgi:cellobiose-specific phosphotransferase system component IIA
VEGLELVAFNIISSVGTARSSYIEAIQKAKEGDFEAAEALIKEGDEVSSRATMPMQACCSRKLKAALAAPFPS